MADPSRILLIEDDRQLGQVVADFLEGSGYLVEFEHKPEKGRDKLLSSGGSFDLIILDWDLGDFTGVEFCRQFRDIGGLTPVLFMTGRNTIDDKESGFEAGADDYITKPFAMRELAARLKSLLRRASQYSPKADLANGIPLSGNLIAGRYLLDQNIGSGGSANVWKAQDQKIGRDVVVKIMLGKSLGNEESLKRFEYECQLMARIKHPNVVTIYDAGCIDGRLPFLVMELVEGESLRDYIEREGRLPVRTAAAILFQIAAGLSEAHNAGIVHRDLKPDNVLIQVDKNRFDAVKIVDFGIARLIDSKDRLTREGTVVGTIDYISPEQLEDRAVDGRADIYALGIIFFELITSTIPFEADSMQAVAFAHLIHTPLNLSERLDGEILQQGMAQQIIDKCLQKKPEDRFQNISQLREALQEILDSQL